MLSYVIIWLLSIMLLFQNPSPLVTELCASKDAASLLGMTIGHFLFPSLPVAFHHLQLYIAHNHCSHSSFDTMKTHCCVLHNILNVKLTLRHSHFVYAGSSSPIFAHHITLLSKLFVTLSLAWTWDI